MNANRDTDALRGAATEHLDLELERAVRFTSDVKKRWHNGAAPDANGVLTEHPDLLRYRSLVLDLAAEEYKCRQASGEAMSADEFAVRFPGLERSLFFLLEVQRMMQKDSALGIPPGDFVWPEVGDDFLGFSLLAELGQGTFGHVFLASEPSLGDRLVALKVAPHGQWEAEILGKLGHPNIVPVYSIQKDPGTGLTAVCMPYLGRVTLLEVIERGFADHKRPRNGHIFSELLKELNQPEETPLPRDFDVLLTRGSYIDGVVHLAVQMADALAFTHEQGIYHRDLKPSNILLSNTGRPLILDFNLSSDEDISPARIGGTLPYMAPEQLQCLLLDGPTAQNPDQALSDIFSLGVILYELISGALPFGIPDMKGGWNDVALDILVRQKKGPLPLRGINPDIDGRLASLIEQCLAFDPQHRFLSAKSLANSLRSQQSIYRRAKRWSQRHPFLIVGGGLFLILCGLACGLWLALRDPYPTRLYKEGLSNLERGNPDAAIRYFNNALDVVPDNREILLERGKTYYRQRNYKLAIEDFRHAFSLEPTNEASAFIGHCLCCMKYYREAIKYYAQALKNEYQSTSLLNNLGYCLMQSMKFRESEDYLRKAISLNPRCSAAWHNLVRLTIKRSNADDITIPDALELINNAITSDKPTPELYIDLAILESRIAKRDPSVIPNIFEHLKKAIALGADPRRIAHELEFKSLQSRKEFSTLLQMSPGILVSREPDGVMSPF